MANFNRKQNKQKQAQVTTAKFLCVNKGRTIALNVVYPVSIPKYKIHEVFNKECIGSKYDLVAEPFHITGYKEMSQQYGTIEFTIEEVKKAD